MDSPIVWLAIWFGAAAVVLLYVVWVKRGDSAGKSYGPDTAMGIGMSDIGRGDTGAGPGAGTGPGSAGGDGSSS